MTGLNAAYQEAFRALMNTQNQLSLQITPVITVARKFAPVATGVPGDLQCARGARRLRGRKTAREFNGAHNS